MKKEVIPMSILIQNGTLVLPEDPVQADLRMDGGNFLGKFFLLFRSCRIMHNNAQRTYPPPW